MRNEVASGWLERASRGMRQLRHRCVCCWCLALVLVRLALVLALVLLCVCVCCAAAAAAAVADAAPPLRLLLYAASAAGLNVSFALVGADGCAGNRAGSH